MSYKIEHKSATECRIAYIENKEETDRKWLKLPVLVFAVIALLIGIDARIVVVGYFIVAFRKDLRKPRSSRTVFEIELNRVKHLISVKRGEDEDSDAMIYPLKNFMGFGLFKLPPGKKKKGRPMAELFLIFDDDFDKNLTIFENSLLNRGNYVTGENDHTFLQVPVQKRHHPTTLWSARKIIGTVDNWLGSRDPAARVAEAPQPEPEQDPEVIRDFRDIE